MCVLVVNLTQFDSASEPSTGPGSVSPLPLQAIIALAVVGGVVILVFIVIGSLCLCKCVHGTSTAPTGLCSHTSAIHGFTFVLVCGYRVLLYSLGKSEEKGGHSAHSWQPKL